MHRTIRRHPVASVLAVVTAAVFTGAADARIVAVNVEKVQPFADGMAFGAVGAYERVSGTMKGELDPADVRNKGIVNLERAPRNARGRVEYEVDFDLLRPKDPARGNRRILFEVTNRGRKFLLHWVQDAPAQGGGAVNDPKSAVDAGNGLFLEQGFTLVWTGWDPEAPRTGNGMAMKIPVPNLEGAPITARIRDQLVSGTRGPQFDRARLAYEAATLDPRMGRLTQRRREADPEREIPQSGWAFVDARTIRLLPDGTKFEPGTLYEFEYIAKDPKPLGVGFAATRDVVSFLRYEAKDDAGVANPAGAGITKAIAIGISQSGRYLRDHIGQGFNQDERSRKVFDGVLAHISGIGRVFMNTEFGMPARTNTQHEDHLYPENAFPFSTAATVDPLTKTRGALLRGDGFDPLVIEVNTSTEYWQKGASLLHTDPGAPRDLALPATARVYQIAGTQHGGQPGLNTDRGPCVNPRNPHNPSPALRALTVALDRWVVGGIAPPPSRVATLRERTLVKPDNAKFPAIPGFTVARLHNVVAPFGSWMNPQPQPDKAYPVYVPATDADGNEVAGIRLPDIAVPLATYTGWNLYAAPFTVGELCDRDGSYAPFAATRAEREKAGDPRKSLEERYGSQAAYVERVRAVAQQLARDGFLLPADAGAYVQAAKSEAVAKRFAGAR